MLLAVIAMLYDRDPKATYDALVRYGFCPGCVKFRKAKARPHRTIVTVERWPWERSS